MFLCVCVRIGVCIYLFIWICVCVRVCVRARACVKFLNRSSLFGPVFVNITGGLWTGIISVFQ